MRQESERKDTYEHLVQESLNSTVGSSLGDWASWEKLGVLQRSERKIPGFWIEKPASRFLPKLGLE